MLPSSDQKVNVGYLCVHPSCSHCDVIVSVVYDVLKPEDIVLLSIGECDDVREFRDDVSAFLDDVIL